MNIANILVEQAKTRASSVAIIDAKGKEERQTSFAELELQSAKMASLLRQSGLKKGDAVLIFQAMSVELYALLTALFRLGLIAVFIDPSAEKGHLERCCKLHAPQALVASSKAHLLRFISAELRRIPIKFSIGPWIPFTKRLEQAHKLEPFLPIEPCASDTAALMTFTSGSTGQPKAAVRTHGFLIAQHKALEKSLTLKAKEIDVSTLPIFVLANLASGLTSLIPNVDLRNVGSVNAERVYEQLLKHKPNRLSSSPAFLERIVEYAQKTNLKLDSLEKVFTGGAPVFPKLMQRTQSVFPNAKVNAVYGSTEAEPIAHIAWHEFTKEDKKAMQTGKGLLTGHVTEDLNLQILKAEWGRPLAELSQAEFDTMTQDINQAGEIVVTGQHVLHGYLTQ